MDMDFKKKVVILGSTGNVGENALRVIRHNPSLFEVEALTAHKNVGLLIEQAKIHKPRLAVIGDETEYPLLKEALAGTGIEVAAGEKAVCEAAARPSDVVLVAILGIAALKPVMAALTAQHVVALANKECLVCAGPLMREVALKHGASILPVDSEHSAIFQVFDHADPRSISHVTLTASGGPFREFTKEAMAHVTPEEAVRHPKWHMGSKISVDSATMMNKGLEMIEAFHLFPLREEQIQVVIHPESIIHSLVHYYDGSVLAQLGTPDMATPIAYALGWPKRIPAPSKPLDLLTCGALTFLPPDEMRFPALRLARDALKNQAAAICLNAANEEAVWAFLGGKIGFLQIIETVEHVLSTVRCQENIASIEGVIAVDREARRIACAYMGNARLLSAIA